MKNPLYIEYRRSTLLGIILVLLLSALGAVVHYVRSLDDNVVQTKFRLSTVGNQLDSEFTPVLAFMEAVRRASLLKMRFSNFLKFFTITGQVSAFLRPTSFASFNVNPSKI